MTFIPGPEAEELRGVLRGFLEKRSAEAEVRRLMETEDGYDPAVWRQMAEELGLPGLIVPEEHGGSGATLVELGVVFEEMGRSLCCSPLFGTVALAANALLAAGDEEANRQHLPGIADGTTRATLAWGGPDPLASTITASPANGGWRLAGTAEVVVDGATADLVLVLAGTPDGLGLFAVTAGGAEATPLTPLDLTRKLAELRFTATPARAVGIPGTLDEELRTAVDRAVVLLACEQLGGAQKVLEMTVEYANTRVQFGRKIGSFQAIKHRCADMLVDVESARSVAYSGAWTAAFEPENLPVSACLAGSLCSEVYTRVTLDNIQNHGGIGFTWEHPAHLYFKRAKSSQLFLGSPTKHRARLAGLLDIPEVVA
ncbi:acyl-CoA dehydrogenase family protein [Pseudonocardia eucalypti]|uniref:Acyl-CoA dehydrogenase family protein n=1 Tax=Pseudonocardia eucalypti TaxID=648755 RepID=A0ABP9R1Z0_9PSEU|nr:alkylation response protein AidB-like acyl-CoA dehydrogenase [Pseudonocardia eucalypti]